MKKFLFPLLLAAAGFASACSPIHTMKDGVSFEGLTRYFINPAEGGDYVFKFSGGRAQIDAMVSSDIEANLSRRGFKRVSDRNDAQFELTPAFTEWNFNYPSQVPPSPETPRPGEIGTSSQGAYATMEIRAALPGMEGIAWRGYSSIKTTRETFGAARIKSQVDGCLRDFPPQPGERADLSL